MSRAEFEKRWGTREGHTPEGQKQWDEFLYVWQAATERAAKVAEDAEVEHLRLRNKLQARGDDGGAVHHDLSAVKCRAIAAAIRGDDAD